jgi:membrane protease YdiL (CAAX protease family)
MHKIWLKLRTWISGSAPPFYSIGGILLLYLLLVLCFVLVKTVHESVWPTTFDRYWYYDSTLSFLVVLSVVLYSRPRLFAFSRWHPRWTDFAIAIPVGALVPAMLWLVVREHPDTLRLDHLPLTSVLPIVCLGPIVEEILFRGAVLKSLRSYLPLTAAVFLGALLVSLAHRHFWMVLPSQLMLSILYVAMGDSMPASIAAHVTNNGCVLALSTGAAEKWHAYLWSMWK